jgi:hypothetical protein
MPDETTPAPAAAPAPSASPAPPSAPAAPPPEPAAPAPAPSTQAALDVLDARTVPGGTMWDRMREQIGLGGEKPAAAEPPTRTRRPPPRPTPGAEPDVSRPDGASAGVPPAAPARRFAERFDTPEALEAGYHEVESARQRAETERARAQETAERLERLLMHAWQQAPAAQAPAEPPPPAPALKAALDAVTNELQLLAVGDQQGDVLRLVRAVALASHADEASRRAYADLALQEYDARSSTERELETLKTKFFDLYPDLKTARPSLLRQVAMETEADLRRARSDYGSASFLQDWFAETAKIARGTLRLSDGAPAAAAAPAADARMGTVVSGAPRPARGAAPFSESPSARPSEPVLTGQDVYLARVFGPR